MTIGLLDPALFLPRDSALIETELGLVLEACIRYNIRLVPLTEYWHPLWHRLGRALEPTLPPKAKRTLQELRKRGESQTELSVPPLLPGSGTVWHDGFKQLFAAIGKTDWSHAMEAATLRAVATGEDVVMFVRRVDKRNLLVHRVGNTTLDENTRWVLHVQAKIAGRKQILCVHHPRNISERWSARFDWRLPCSPDARFPFCVPLQWWKRATPAFGTIQSKPCWIDRHGNGWARPNINAGAGYHWDVYINNSNHVALVGLNQVNVVQFGAPAGEGKAGWIHHVPGDKAGKVNLEKRGWSCE